MSEIINSKTVATIEETTKKKHKTVVGVVSTRGKNKKTKKKQQTNLIKVRKDMHMRVELGIGRTIHYSCPIESKRTSIFSAHASEATSLKRPFNSR